MPDNFAALTVKKFYMKKYLALFCSFACILTAAAQNPKKVAKVATWLKLADSYLKAYDAPASNVYQGANKQELMFMMGYDRALLFWSDGHKGLQQFAPFKAIIVACCAQEIPQELLLQLEIGGRLVVPVEENGQQVMAVVERISENEFNRTTHGKCSFVPMLEGVNR